MPLNEADLNRYSDLAIQGVVADAMRDGANQAQLLELAEVTVAAACLMVSNVDDDDLVLQLLVNRIKRRLAKLRLVDAVPAGHS